MSPSLTLLIFLFFFGSIIGSFLTVVIYRITRGETIVWGRSHCPYCKHELGSRDLMPIVSFISQRGRCRYCQRKLSWLYPEVEVSTGVLFVLAYFVAFRMTGVPLSIQGLTLIYLCILFSIFVALFYIDWLELLLPDVLVFTALAVTLAYHLLFWLLSPTTFTQQASSIWFGYLFGIALSISFLILIVVTKGKGMGGGDMKFALVLGAAASWPGALGAVFFAFITGAVVSLALIALRKKSMKDVIPFGPFLIAGTIFAIVCNTWIVDFTTRYLLG